MEAKICMVTGHRKIDPSKTEFIKQELRREVMLAIEDGYTQFICGFTECSDIIIADIMEKLREDYSIKTETVISYLNSIHTMDGTFQSPQTKCDADDVHSEIYADLSIIIRNCYMVQNAERVLVVYDGRENGCTIGTIRFAHKMEKEVRVISI